MPTPTPDGLSRPPEMGRRAPRARPGSAASWSVITPQGGAANLPEQAGQTPVEAPSAGVWIDPCAGSAPLPAQWPMSGIVMALAFDPRGRFGCLRLAPLDTGSDVADHVLPRAFALEVLTRRLISVFGASREHGRHAASARCAPARRAGRLAPSLHGYPVEMAPSGDSRESLVDRALPIYWRCFSSRCYSSRIGCGSVTSSCR